MWKLVLLSTLPGCLITRSEIAAKGDADADTDTDTDADTDTDIDTEPPLPRCEARYGPTLVLSEVKTVDAFALVAGDLDGDGREDLAGYKEELLVVENQGANAFGEAVYSGLPVKGLALGDVETDDAAAELAVVADGDVLLGNYAGGGFTFGPPITSGALLVGVADVSGGGGEDLVVVDSDSVAYWTKPSDTWMEFGNSTATGRLDLSTSALLVEGDVGGDGDTDFAILGEASVAFVEDTGNALDARPVEGLDLLYRIALVDVDGVPGVELVGIGETGALSVARYDVKTKGWASFQEIPRVSSGFPLAASALDFEPGCRALFLADFERLELWFPDELGALDPIPVPLAPPDLGGVGPVVVTGATAIDVNGDQMPDVVALVVQDGISYFVTWLIGAID